MNKYTLLSSLAAICVIAPLQSLSAGVIYNDDLVDINGSGNPNGGFTSNTNATDNLLLALRFKVDSTGSTANTDGVYTDSLGVFDNIEFDVDTGADGLSASSLDVFTYELTLTSNLGNTASFAVTALPDNAYGIDTTANGAGSIGAYSAFDSGPDYIMQNSEDPKFGFAGGINFADNQTLTATLTADNSDHRPVDSVSVQLVVGNGGPVASAPDSAAAASLLAIGIVGIALGRRKFATAGI